MGVSGDNTSDCDDGASEWWNVSDVESIPPLASLDSLTSDGGGEASNSGLVDGELFRALR